jgi:hypothetical protein
MKTKNFLASGIAGGIVDFLLGWIFYGMLLTNLYPEGETMNMLFIFLGCMSFGLFVAYVFTKWAGITTLISGLKAGAILGFFYGLTMNLFMYSGMEANYQNMAIDVIVNIIIGAGVGAVVAYVNGKIE